jgi:hypothetical protein
MVIRRWAGQHEGHRRGGGQVAVGVDQHRGGHERAAVLLIEARGGLDLGHFLAGGQQQADRLLDGHFLGAGGIDQLDPHGVLGQTPVASAVAGLEAGGAVAQNSQHGSASLVTRRE